MKKPTVGFSIPVYDTALELSKCLESLSDQTIIPDEIVVVDDSSPNRAGIKAVVDGFRDSQLYPTTPWYVYADYGEKRFRKCQAFNLGASVLSTDIVFYSQADMLYPKDYVERNLSLHAKYDNIVVYPHIYHFNNLEMLKELETFSEIPDSSLTSSVKDFETDVVWSTEDMFAPGNGVGMASCLSVRRKNDVGWDNMFVATGGDEDDYYHRSIDAGLVPVMFKDLTAVHAHCGNRDVSFLILA